MTKLLTRNDIKEIVTEIVAENNKYLKDDILKFKDEILGEIVNLRDDFAVLTGYRDMIEDHGVRIEKLEHEVFHEKN
jgi:hypothetical protein